MTPDETIDLLSVAAAFDRRTTGESDVMAWHATIGDLDFADSRAAVIGHRARASAAHGSDAGCSAGRARRDRSGSRRTQSR